MWLTNKSIRKALHCLATDDGKWSCRIRRMSVYWMSTDSVHVYVFPCQFCYHYMQPNTGENITQWLAVVEMIEDVSTSRLCCCQSWISSLVKDTEAQSLALISLNCKWDKPRKESKPIRIDCIDFRKQTTTAIPTAPKVHQFTSIPEQSKTEKIKLQTDIKQLIIERSEVQCSFISYSFWLWWFFTDRIRRWNWTAKYCRYAAPIPWFTWKAFWEHVFEA